MSALSPGRALMAEVWALIEDEADCERTHCSAPASVAITIGQTDGGGALTTERDLILCLPCGLDFLATMRSKGQLRRG